MSCGITLVRNILGITLATYIVTSPQRPAGAISHERDGNYGNIFVTKTDAD